ncbi:MAG TPA: hypothetical protein VJR06_02580 [Nitrososphaerales archaeon]|nr:hypothetical protein [Nitrososphaerales archaeon]
MDPVKRDRIAVVVALVAVFVVAASFEIGILPPGGRMTTTTTCTTCYPEPVVDVVMPALGNSGNFTNPNRQINMTAGEAKTYEVDVYPTAPLGFSMSFNTVIAPGPGSQSGGPWIAASFVPQSMTVGANSKGSTMMTLTVDQSAARGTYDVVVSATNQSNGTQVWGLYFEISVA